MFVWMSKEHLCVLVYVVTVMHSMQAGYMDKAQKYTEKAFMQIEKLKRELQTSFYFIFKNTEFTKFLQLISNLLVFMVSDQ